MSKTANKLKLVFVTPALYTTGSADALQMLLRFRDDQEEKEEEKPQQDLSLDLFA